MAWLREHGTRDGSRHDDRLVAAASPDRRVRHRRVYRLAVAADRSRHRAVVVRGDADLRPVRGADASNPRLRRHIRGYDGLRRRGAGDRGGGRPAGRALRSGLRRPRLGQMHLRHRRFPAGQRRSAPPPFGQRPGRLHRVEPRRRADVLPGRSGVHGGFGRPLAYRHRRDRRRARTRRLRCQRDIRRWRAVRPRARRPRRSVVVRVEPRRGTRAQPGNRARASGSRVPRRHRRAGHDAGRRDAVRSRAGVAGVARRRRAHPIDDAHATTGRSAPAAGSGLPLPRCHCARHRCARPAGSLPVGGNRGARAGRPVRTAHERDGSGRAHGAIH